MIKPKYLLLTLLTLAIFASCSKKPVPEPIHNKHVFPEIEKAEPQPDLSDLVVDFSCEGLEDGHLTLDFYAVRLPIEVSMNKENVRWTVESNRDWCSVRQEEHRGPGSILLMVDANENFFPRDTATLTFVAGDYRGPKISVSQDCTGFIISQPYFFVGKDGGDIAFTINLKPGYSGSGINSAYDLGCTVKSYQNSDGSYYVVFTYSYSKNTGSTRFDIFEVFCEYGGWNWDHWFPAAVTQFGNDIERDSYGRIILDGNVDSKLSFQFPEMMVRGFDMPDYITPDVKSNGDGTVTITLTFPKVVRNYSGYIDSYVDFLLRSESCPYVSLPVVRRYYDASY